MYHGDNINTDLYSSKIIKASALIPDTKLLLSHWDLEKPVKENLQLAKEQNYFGKKSRSRIDDILRIFQQRYLDEPSVLASLVQLVNQDISSQELDRLLYYFSFKSDPLLYDIVTQLIYEINITGRRDLYLNDLIKKLHEWNKQGKTKGHWNDKTVERIAQGISATLRDFGLLEGGKNKSISPFYLPTTSFSFISYYLYKQGIQSPNIVIHPDWKLFLLYPESVERFFLEADRKGLLSYNAAGNIIRIDYPVDNIEEYATYVANRAD